MKEQAKEIRKILKKEFPNIKFRVRSDIHSVNIRYEDGVPVKQIESHVMKFEKIYRDEVTLEILSGGNSFIFINREYSRESKNKVYSEVDTILKNRNMNFDLSILKKVKFVPLLLRLRTLHIL